jgi:hypothetical protein
MVRIEKDMSRSRPGRKNGAYKHGMKHSPEYTAWCGIIRRCEAPKAFAYDRYGGRGIKICNRWRESFEAFYEDMGPKPSPLHTIDRIDNDGHYEPGNCRWTTMKRQCRNRSSNHTLEYNGETLALSEWEERTGIPANRISRRIRRGWTAEMALTKKTKDFGRLSHDDVRLIRSLIRDGLSNNAIAKKFGVVRDTIRNIRIGSNWRGVQ